MVSLASLTVLLGFVAGAFSVGDLLMVDVLTTGIELFQADSAGLSTDIVDQTTFNAMSKEEFSAYKAIVIGDRSCDMPTNIGVINFLNTNKIAWSSAITGNIVLLGTETQIFSNTVEIKQLVTNSITVAASQEGATGLYYSTSCYTSQTPLDVLSYFGTFNTVVNLSLNEDCGIHEIAESPVLGGLSDVQLSAWCESTFRTKFTAYPSTGSNPFVPLAILRDPLGETFEDGSVGIPYILFRGPTPPESTTTSTTSTMSAASFSTVDETSSTASAPFSSDKSSEASSSLKASAPASSEPLSTGASSLEYSESSKSPSFTSLIPWSTTGFRFFNTSTTSIPKSDIPESDSPSATPSPAGSESLTRSLPNPTMPDMSSKTSSPSGSESLAPSAVSPATQGALPVASLPTNIPTSGNTGAFPGPFPTPGSPSGGSSSAMSPAPSSSTGPLPSTGPTKPTLQLSFIVQLVISLNVKRQSAPRFAIINSAGNLAVTTDCLQSSLLSITDEGRMVSNSLVARALPANIVAGSGPFTFALPQPGEIDTTFLLSGSNIVWNNNTFGNGNAIFAINPTSQLVEVFYSGQPPLNYPTLVFSTVVGESVSGACAALAGSTTPSTPLGTAPVPAITSPSSLSPVGIELIVYVIIQTVIVGGETVCLTEPARTSTRSIYRSAVPGYPCYACLMASQNIERPSDDKKKFTVVTSSCTEPNSALFTEKPSAVYMPCQACAATTLRGAAITPGVARGGNLAGFSPAKTLTIGGGEVIFGSKTVDGKVVNTALAVPANAPYPVGGGLPAPPQPAKPAAGDVKPAGDAKPVGVDYPNVAPNTGSRPIQVDTPGKPPVDVSTKGAEAPTEAPQPIKPVLSSSAPSFVKCLTFLHFMLLVLII